MKDRIRTLLLTAMGFRWQAKAAGTLLGLLGKRPTDPLPMGLHNHPWMLRLFPYGSLSYTRDWEEAFLAEDRLEVTTCDVMNLAESLSCMRRIREYELIIIMHSAVGDAVCTELIPFLAKRRSPLALFFGNEYDLMEKKIRFANAVAADYLCTQLPLQAAKFVYQDCTGEIVEMPHALNPSVYYDMGLARDVDIGFRGAAYHRVVGDTERTDLLRYFQNPQNTPGFVTDVVEQMLPRDQWARYLNRCKGIVGAESGTYYLDRGGKTITRVKKYLKKRPRASMEELHERFFSRCGEVVSGKAVSSRHFEPMGTKTCQILVQGRYNGILTAGEHYIPVKKDLSDVDEALEKFRDSSLREKIASQALEHALGGHTYAHRVRTLLQRMGAA
ncbi:MAG: glycosyltransferase family 1 protein [Deltaproteobacteria bacterium]|nr:glycosyltransferase family 1 protein [Deltaproteobacteria bacterium]